MHRMADSGGADLCDAQKRWDVLEVLAHDAIFPHPPIPRHENQALYCATGQACGTNIICVDVGELTEPRTSCDIVVSSKVLVRGQSMP